MVGAKHTHSLPTLSPVIAEPLGQEVRQENGFELQLSYPGNANSRLFPPVAVFHTRHSAKQKTL